MVAVVLVVMMVAVVTVVANDGTSAWNRTQDGQIPMRTYGLYVGMPGIVKTIQLLPGKLLLLHVHSRSDHDVLYSICGQRILT